MLYQNQIGTFYPLGGEKVRLGHDEMKKIKNFAPPGMQLMGFKPRSYLKVYHNIKHSYFLHPDEKKTQGASQCADALIKEMVAQDKIAIVKFTPRENSQVRLCAMIAQEEKIDPNDGFQTPAGFQLIPLPYADDIRDNKQILQAAGFEQKPDQSNQQGIIQSLSTEEKNAAKLIVKNLNIEFDSRNFENPAIQKFYSGLQALALNEEEPEEVQNLLEPDYEGLKTFQPVLNNFKDVFYEGNDEDPEIVGKPKAQGGRGRGRARPQQFSSSSSQSGARPQSKGRGRGKKTKREEVIFEEDSEEESAVVQKKSKQTNKRRKVEKATEDPEEEPRGQKR